MNEIWQIRKIKAFRRIWAVPTHLFFIELPSFSLVILISVQMIKIIKFYTHVYHLVSNSLANSSYIPITQNWSFIFWVLISWLVSSALLCCSIFARLCYTISCHCLCARSFVGSFWYWIMQNMDSIIAVCPHSSVLRNLADDDIKHLKTIVLPDAFTHTNYKCHY